MGAECSKSVDEINSSDIAAYVAALGNSYKEYEEAIRLSGISGSELAGMKGERILIQLETMGVANRMHRRKLACVARSQFGRVKRRNSDDGSVNTLGSNFSGMDGGSSHSGGYSSTGSLGGSVGSDHTPLGGASGHSRPRSSFASGSSRSLNSFGDTDTDDDLSVGQMKMAPKAAPKAAPNAVLENMCVANSAEALMLLIGMENQKRLISSQNKPTGPPMGKATIILTDVQGSTSLWEADPQAMREALSLHDEIIRQHRAKHGGYEIDTEGDAFFLAFHSAKDALSFALDLQAALHDAPWNDDILAQEEAKDCPVTHMRGLRVRMGIHMGPVTTRPNAVTGRLEYTGETMERAKEVEGMADGGQILTTRSTWDAAELAARIEDRGNGVVQVLCSQRKSQAAPAFQRNDSLQANDAKARAARQKQRRRHSNDGDTITTRSSTRSGRRSRRKSKSNLEDSSRPSHKAIPAGELTAC